jgi:hypothetical protein
VCVCVCVCKKEQKYGIKGQNATNTHYFALSISWNSLDLR